MGLVELELKEWETRTLPLSQDLRDGFLRDREALAEARALAQAELFDLRESSDALTISARSYVGRIHLGNLSLIIRPKLPFSMLMHLLQYAYSLGNIRTLAEADLLTEKQTFHDLLILCLVQQAAELLRRGLHRNYQSQSADLPSPRGRIDFQRIACGRWDATLPCRYHERSFDCLVNQALLAGLHLAAGITTSDDLRARLYGLTGLMEGVKRIDLHPGIMRRLAREDNRLVAAYRPLIRLISLLLMENGVAMQGPFAKENIPGFLFDMNRFFQALLARFLRESLAPWEVVEEFRLRAMMRYQREFNPRRRQSPTPRPDFAVKIDGRIAALLDAKYRDLWQNDLPRDMLYQLAIYALGHELKASRILYPTSSPEASEARIAIADPFSGSDAAMVSLWPVNLPTLEELLTADQTMEIQRKRRQYAETLVGVI